MLRQVKWVWKVLMTSKARRELRLAAMDEPPSFPRDSTRYVQSARKCKKNRTSSYTLPFEIDRNSKKEKFFGQHPPARGPLWTRCLWWMAPPDSRMKLQSFRRSRRIDARSVFSTQNHNNPLCYNFPKGFGTQTTYDLRSLPALVNVGNISWNMRITRWRCAFDGAVAQSKGLTIQVKWRECKREMKHYRSLWRATENWVFPKPVTTSQKAADHVKHFFLMLKNLSR